MTRARVAGSYIACQIHGIVQHSNDEPADYAEQDEINQVSPFANQFAASPFAHSGFHRIASPGPLDVEITVAALRVSFSPSPRDAD